MRHRQYAGYRIQTPHRTGAWLMLIRPNDAICADHHEATQWLKRVYAACQSTKTVLAAMTEAGLAIRSPAKQRF